MKGSSVSTSDEPHTSTCPLARIMSPIDVERPTTQYTFSSFSSTISAAPLIASFAKKKLPVTRWRGQCCTSFSASR